MSDLCLMLTPPQRGATLVALSDAPGRDFMGWRRDAMAAVRSPGGSTERLANIAYCALSHLLALHRDGHRRRSDALVAEALTAYHRIATAYGWQASAQTVHPI